MKSFEPDVDFLEYVLSGEAVLWIGAGASAEMGYPSWEKQADDVRLLFEKNGVPYDKDGFEKYFASKDYSSAFSALSRKVGKKKLLEAMQIVTSRKGDGKDTIYNEVTKWPISSYVTTNFDDEIVDHLKHNRPEDRYTVVGNTDSEMSMLGREMDHLVFKVHGSLADEKNSVVTFEDYHNFTTARKSFQQGLVRLFKNKKVIIIGYSLGDKDVQLALECANEYGKAKHPVYLLLSDVTETDMAIKKNVFNIKIMPYDNSDKHHSQLGRILANYGLFLSSRGRGRRITSESRDAVPLFLFRNLNRTARTVDANNYILMKSPTSRDKAIDLKGLKECVGIRRINLNLAVEELKSEGLLIADEEGRVKRLPKGDEKVESVKQESESLTKIAYQNFVQAFERPLTISEEEQLTRCAKTCIESFFDKQGIEMLRSIYQTAELDGYSMRDMYEIIAEQSKTISDINLRLSFIRAIRSFVVSPTKVQRKYLASLSQGYVMYHMLGLGKSCKEELEKISKRDVWYVDSNVIQPLLARFCPSHKLAAETFALIKKQKIVVRTTSNVIREVEAHFNWARRHIPGKDDVRAVVQIPENDDRYNFFIAGYVSRLASEKVITFDEYCEDLGACTRGWVAEVLKKYGIEVEPSPEDSEYKAKLEKAQGKITALRKSMGTFSSNELQVPTDSELYVHMCDTQNMLETAGNDGRVNFLSLSGLFNKTEVKFSNWSMARFVRYVTLMSERWASVETVSDCLRSELCTSGITIIDEGSLDELFGQEICTADLNLKREKKRLGTLLYEISDLSESDLNDRLRRMPKYERALFTDQLISRVNAKALDEERSKTAQLSSENKSLEEENARLRAIIERSSLKTQVGLKGPSRKNKKIEAGRNRASKQAVRKIRGR